MVGSSTRALAVAGLEILDEIGRGAHAIVYRARHDGTDYALKMLRSDLPGQEEASAAIRREAGLLACVDDPCVGRVYEVGAVGGLPYLVMELLDGRSLTEILDAGPLSVPQTIRLATDLAGALAAAHRVGVVHRDVKPQNIMVVAGGQPKLVDFGLAVHSHRSSLDETAGTFAYSAPEQTGMLSRTVDGRADLYSLGVVLFECLTGTRPFDAADVGELIRLHAVAVPPDVSTLRSGTPIELAAVIGRLLAKDPDDRYQDGESLAQDLRAMSASPLDAGVPARSARRPLVGRQAELVRLESRWKQTRQGHGGVVRLTGRSGSGKSRLADELTDRVRAAGHPVLDLMCAEGAAPLAPVRAALDRHVRDLERLPTGDCDEAVRRLRAAAGAGASVLQLLSPALAGVLQAPTLADEDLQEQLGTAVAVFLGDLARSEGGLLLSVDNAQWLDTGTARLLRELAPALRTSPLLVLTTEPTESDGVDGVDGAERLAPAVSGASAPETRIRLRPLDEPQVAELASGQLGGAAVDAQLGSQLTHLPWPACST